MNDLVGFNFTMNASEWQALRPILTIGIGAMITLLLSTINPKTCGDKRILISAAAAVSLVLAFVFTLMGWRADSLIAFNGVLSLDRFHSFFNLIFCGSGLMIVLASYRYLEQQKIHYSEYYSLLLLSIFGMMCMTASLDLITMFVSLEIMSLAVYVLVGMRRSDQKSNEAAIKYFVLGGVASAILLYGISFIYGALNTTSLISIASQLTDGGYSTANPILLMGFLMVFVGFLFKVAVFPFHIWTPDVYQGAPAIVTSFMSTALKAAAFAAFIRFFSMFIGKNGATLGEIAPLAHDLIWYLSIATMVIGNFVALQQTNLKRLLAYSAIAHTGYLMIGMLVGPKVGYSSILLYFIPYAVMNIGAFAIIGMLAGKMDAGCRIDRLAGFGYRHPYLAGALTIFMFSLAGLPPTGGFVAKYFLFSAALEANEVLLALIAVGTSLVSVYYYLRVVIFMYMKEEAKELAPIASGGLAWVTIAVCAFLTMQSGVFPAAYLEMARSAALF